jgi:ribonuclease D
MPTDAPVAMPGQFMPGPMMNAQSVQMVPAGWSQPQNGARMQPNAMPMQQRGGAPRESDDSFQVSVPNILNLIKEMLIKTLQTDSDEMAAVIFELLNDLRRDQITKFIKQRRPDTKEVDLFRAVITEITAEYIARRVQVTNQLVKAAAEHVNVSTTPMESRKRLTAALLSAHLYKREIITEFLTTFVSGLIQDRSLALTAVKALVDKNKLTEVIKQLEFPTEFIAHIIEILLDFQTSVARTSMEYYSKSGHMTLEAAKHHLMKYFLCYTVDSSNASVDVRDGPKDTAFMNSAFRVILVDNYGYLLHFLRRVEAHVEEALQQSQTPLLSVDFEGVKLCRSGELCLAQFQVGNDPCTVFVVDVYKLGKGAFQVTSPKGTSIHSILEDTQVRKIWFDPRNDVDALAHQFSIRPQGIFDLQLAEVAERRMRALGVRYVQGLFKSLNNCNTLSDEHKSFAGKIDSLGKNMFEPEYGGNYEVFRIRPIHPIILVYAAHDVRYMLMLYESLTAQISQNPSWFERIIAASTMRGNWWRHEQYMEPNSEAPEF